MRARTATQLSRWRRDFVAVQQHRILAPKKRKAIKGLVWCEILELRSVGKMPLDSPAFEVRCRWRWRGSEISAVPLREGYSMKRLPSSVVASIFLLFAGGAVPANAQSLNAKVVGVWTLKSGSENFADGKKNMPWATGNLIVDPSGHLAYMLIGKDQPKTSPNPQTPVGPAVACYGTYTFDEANNVLTQKTDHCVSPLGNGGTHTYKVSFSGDTMTWTGSEVKTAKGMITPVNQW